MSERQSISAPGRDNFIARLARQLGLSANATTIFAPPVERGGVTVIPVAKAVYGCGGGGDEAAGGFGGGGGVVVKPHGYIEIKDGGTRFRPIRNLSALIPACAVGGLLTILVTRGLVKLWRSSRPRLIPENDGCA